VMDMLICLSWLQNKALTGAGVVRDQMGFSRLFT
jgi:hypothetical protein